MEAELIGTNTTSDKNQAYKDRKAGKLTKKQSDILETITEHPDLSTREVATLTNTAHSYVVNVMQRYGLQKQLTEDYKNHRADILAGIQNKLITSLTDEDIKKAPLGSRVLAVCQLFDKERLERGKSTDNIMAIHAIVSRIDEIEAKEAVDV